VPLQLPVGILLAPVGHQPPPEDIVRDDDAAGAQEPRGRARLGAGEDVP
jgi:hypothetical protein